jgi:ribosomal protein S18 acetylase RimI-like enzyme
MNVRAFQLSDHYSLIQLLKDILSDSCYEDTIKALANQLSWDCELVLLAENEKKIVGFIMGTIDQNQGYFYRLAVDSDFQRKGIGKSLLVALQQKFMQRKVKKVMISLDQHNEGLIPFYHSLGFENSDFSNHPQRLSIVKHA